MKVIQEKMVRMQRNNAFLVSISRIKTQLNSHRALLTGACPCKALYRVAGFHRTVRGD